MTIRYRGQQIQSYMPAVDARSDDRPRVLGGRNFEFDVKGPKAGFGNQILTPFPFSKPRGVQGLRVRDRTFVITQDAILVWRTNAPFNWELIHVFQAHLPDPLGLPWFGFYVEDQVYLGHPSRGIFHAEVEENTMKMTLRLLTDDDIPGLPEEVYGAAIVRNRVILVTKNVTHWSGVGNFTTLEPSPGGAGFQLNDDFIEGEFRGIAPFNDGFMIWTSQGGILAEHIGGQAVWRWSPVTSPERPIGPWATQTLSNGMTILLTRRGLKYTVNGDIPADWTQEFNEFFRNYVETLIHKETIRFWRIAYDMNTEQIYLSESADGFTYWRTYVFNPTLDKWGIFSENVYGIIPLTESLFGFVDELAVPRYFDGGIYWDENPDNARGLNRTYPRVQKVGWPPSSSAVSRVLGFNDTYPIELLKERNFMEDEVVQPGWHDSHSMSIQTYEKTGLKSWIEIGYLKPPEMDESADGNMEIHELLISSPPSSPHEPLTFEVTGFEHLWDWPFEDWNSIPFFMGFDFAADLMLLDGIFDLGTYSGPTIDCNKIKFWMVQWSQPVVVEDWNLEEGFEDWNGATMNRPEYLIKPTLLYSMDGSTELELKPELARFDSESRLFTAYTHGGLHRLRLEAINPLEYYHVTFLEFTMEYGGEWI